MQTAKWTLPAVEGEWKAQTCLLAGIDFRLVCNQELTGLNPTSVGMDNWTSVPNIGLLKIFTRPPIPVARSRMPVRPQCPERPE